MKAVYFPHTYIDLRQAEWMTAIWGPLTLLQPSPEIDWADLAAMREAGHIEPIFPAGHQQQPLQDALQALQQWAAQNTGRDLAAMMEQGQQIPFFPSDTASNIVAEIRKGGRATARNATVDQREKQFRALLLLAMAQEFDRQQQELGRDIETLAAKESEMMASLRGEIAIDADAITGPWTAAADASDLLIGMRLKAWACVMTSVAPLEAFLEENSEILFLTGSREVLAQIKEMFPQAQTRLESVHPGPELVSVRDVASLPAWLADRLTAGGRDVSLGAPFRPAECDLVEIPGMPVETFLLRLANQTHAKVSDRSSGPYSGSCWIACMIRPD